MDNLTSEKRSENMRRIRSKGMKPEIAVRKAVFKLGFRYRLHAAGLPGKPDLVFRKTGKIIFVNGCFWHFHNDGRCPVARMPKSNTRYWRKKLAANKKRDEKNLQALRKLGWRVLVIWECQIRKNGKLENLLSSFLSWKRP